MPDQTLRGFSTEERQIIDETLRFVAERAWSVTGAEFFSDLVTFLGTSLNVDYALCDRIDPTDETVVHSLAVYAHGTVTENITYNLEGTPCQNVVGRMSCCYEYEVQQKFPHDQLLIDLNAESYAGVPLWTAEGAPLGLIAVMDTGPLHSPELVVTVLQILATRAGSELERVEVLNKFKQSEQRFADFAAISSDWFWETDADLRFSFFSDSFQSITGVAPNFLLGKTRAEVGAPGSQPEAYQQLLLDLTNHKEIRDFEHHRVMANGAIHYLSISAKPAYDETGAFIGYRGVGRNITRQKGVELELIESRDKATKANNAKSEFLANMSHELRTPLNSIIGYSQAMESEIFGPMGNDMNKECAAIIHASGTHLHGIIGDILDLSKIEAGEEEVFEEETDIGEVLDECKNMMFESAIKKQLGLSVDIQHPMPLVRLDRLKFKQILLNLLSNSVKFTPDDGAIEIKAWIDTDQALKVQVADSGVGISEKDIAYIMLPFSQVGDAYTRSHGGTGLGLALVKSLTDLHGGSVDITSVLKEGTTATLSFPAERTVV